MLCEKYKGLAEADNETEKGDRTKLGSYSYIKKMMDGSSLKNVHFYIFNAYTFFESNRDGKSEQFDYKALENMLDSLNYVHKQKLFAFAMPQGANFSKIIGVMRKAVKTYKILVVEN